MGIGRDGETLKEMVAEQDAYLKKNKCYVDKLTCKAEDPIKYEIFFSRLQSLLISSKEIAKLISASPMVREVGELVFGLYTPEGDSTTLSTGIMCHVHTLSRFIKWIIEHDYETAPGIRHGDYFANNDPSISGSHAPDVMDITPIIYEGELVGWAGGVTHVLDVGATTPAGMGIEQVSRFNDGLYVGALKVGENDQLSHDYELWVSRNVRIPAFWILDEKARMAAAANIRDGVIEVIKTFGLDYYRRALKEVIEECRRSSIAKVKQLFVPGRYRTAMFYDVPLAGKPVPPIAAVDRVIHMPQEMTIDKEGAMSIDFEGTTPTSFHSHNANISGMEGAFFVGVTQVIGYDGRANDGLYYATKLKVPHGSCLYTDNPHVSMGNGWWIMIVSFSGTFGLLSRGLYAKGYREEILNGCAGTGGALFGGVNTYNQRFGTANPDGVACGSGARGIMDGIDTGYQIWNPEADMGNAELWEMILPQVMLGRKVIADSGGYGKYRGGNSFETIYMMYHSKELEMGKTNTTFNVFDCRGIMGGYPSVAHYNNIARGTNVKGLIEKKKPLPHGEGPDPSNPEIAQLVTAEKMEIGAEGGQATVPIQMYDLWEVFHRSGAGYGDPIERDPEAVLADFINGHCMIRTAEKVYGVVINEKTEQVDQNATKALRKKIREQRLKRGIPVADFKKQERKKILDGTIHSVIKKMYNESINFSKSFADEFVNYWNLPSEFRFKEE